MGKNWAIAVGINSYSNLLNLKYAKADAEAMKYWFEQEAKFDEVFLFTEDSPAIPAKPSSISTEPTYGHLRRFLRAQFEKPLLKSGDNLWFFFAGHGRRYKEQDYLMLSDSDPGDVEETAISVDYVTQRLRKSGADNVILFLDACRDESRRGEGIKGEYKGVVTFYSCSPEQRAYEIDQYNHGSFTYALLEGLRIQGEGNCATVERLEQHLRNRVSQITRQHRKEQQNPYASAEPATKLHLILLPNYATLTDINILKLDAFQAEAEQDWELAKQLWVRVNVAAGGSDWQAIEAFPRVDRRRREILSPNHEPITLTSEPATPSRGIKIATSETLNQDRKQYQSQHTTIYIIGIGGTGAKCVEAVTRLASVGLFPDQPIKTLFIDADETNGNLDRSRSSLNTYEICYQLVSGGNKQKCPWMKTKIESFDLWSPFTELNSNKELKSFFNYNTMKQNQPALGNLFDVLYTKDEQEVSLDVGFRGRPAIGSAVMSQVDLEKLDKEPWGSFVKSIQSDVSAGKAAKVFLCGSIFGGTGASGLPTIARLIANKLNRLNIKERTKIGCLFLLPYFGFSTPPGDNSDGIYARSEQFLLNTEAALRYYVTQAQETFDTVYLLGNEKFSRVEFSIGKNSQRNEAHFLEVYAALAARHFLLNTKTLEDKVVLIGRDSVGRLTWNDIPEENEVKTALVNGARFAYTWLASIMPELTENINRTNDLTVLTSWMRNFFLTSNTVINDSINLSDLQQQDAIKIIRNWCLEYLGWLYDVHQCEGEQIQLFVHSIFQNPEGNLNQEQLTELVFENDLDRRIKAGDTIHTLKKKLRGYLKDTAANVDVVELARSLYTLCRQ